MKTRPISHSSDKDLQPETAHLITSSSTVPAGWKLVPVEPTDAMALAAIKVSLRNPAINGIHHSLVHAFLVKFYGNGGQWAGCDEPMHTLPTKDRMGLVMVAGEPYRIADIGLRMLQPRELARAQGFGDDYLLSAPDRGLSLPKHAQVRMIGNSVCPPMAHALVTANYSEMNYLERRAA